MHFCTAHIAIGGDNRNIMYRDEFAPISWPEVYVLREIHGGNAVTEIRPFANVRQSARAERERLSMKYGDEVLGVLWGGKNPPPELDAEGVKPKKDIVWMNPLSGQTEKTTDKGSSEPYTIPPEERTVAEVVGNYAVRDDAVAQEEKPHSEMYSDDDYPEDVPVPVEENPTEAPKAKKK